VRGLRLASSDAAALPTTNGGPRKVSNEPPEPTEPPEPPAGGRPSLKRVK
jgi:hypothetical protein